MVGVLVALLLQGYASQENMFRNEPGVPDVVEDTLFSEFDSVVMNESVEQLLENQRVEGQLLENQPNVVFISVSDSNESAHVFHASADSLGDAWEKVKRKAEKYIQDSDYQCTMQRVDVLSSSISMKISELCKELAANPKMSYRLGLVLNDSWDVALLEEECNAQKIYDYSKDRINTDRLKEYLGYNTLGTVKDSVIVFDTVGWYLDNNGEVVPLTESRHRKSEMFEKEYLEELMRSGAEYLKEQVKPNGEFEYGYYPCTDKPVDGYNLTRHAGTVWAMIQEYSISKNEESAKAINAAVNYLLNNVMYLNSVKVYPGVNAAFVYNKEDNTVELGTCALTLLALIEYDEVFETDVYDNLCESLGQGLLEFIDRNKVAFNHVLNRDLSVKVAFKTEYFTDEAVFALCRLGKHTNGRMGYSEAEMLVREMCNNAWEIYHDHWTSYAMNELTQGRDSMEYWELGLKNITSNYQILNNIETVAPIYTELMMSGFEMWDRCKNLKPGQFDFNEQRFYQALAARIQNQANGYFYPEVAMYMQNPARVIGTFMSRNNNFRIRIDDVQHNIGGLYLVWKNLDKLNECGVSARLNDVL